MTCPVCFYPALPYPPRDYHICPCCGTEFGNDDDDMTHAELRQQWIDNGARWFFRTPPIGWSAAKQLLRAQFGLYVNAATEPFTRGEVVTVGNFSLKKTSSGTFSEEPVYMFGT
jgi:hypothetical protein